MPWIQHDDLGPVLTAVISSNPEAMNALKKLIYAVTFDASALTRVQEEAIATVVSATNKCQW